MNMEFIKNRQGDDRVIEKISSTKLRIIGESLFSRKSFDNDKCLMYDFEGGPCLNLGGKIKFGNLDWIITSIQEEETDKENFCSVIIEVKL